MCSCNNISDNFWFTGTDSPAKNPSIVCPGGIVPLDKISILSENAVIIGAFPVVHWLCTNAFIIASRNASSSNRGISFLSTILSRSSACGTFSTPPYSRTLSNDISKQVFPNSRTEYIVDVLSLPLKIAKRIGMPLLSDINCANILYFPLSSKKPRFFLKVLLFSVIPFDA